MTIDDHLMQTAQDSARRRGQTVGEVIEASLRRELSCDVGVLGDGKALTWALDMPSGGEISCPFTDEDSPRA